MFMWSVGALEQDGWTPDVTSIKKSMAASIPLKTKRPITVHIPNGDRYSIWYMAPIAWCSPNRAYAEPSCTHVHGVARSLPLPVKRSCHNVPTTFKPSHRNQNACQTQPWLHLKPKQNPNTIMNTVATVARCRLSARGHGIPRDPKHSAVRDHPQLPSPR